MLFLKFIETITWHFILIFRININIIYWGDILELLSSKWPLLSIYFFSWSVSTINVRFIASEKNMNTVSGKRRYWRSCFQTRTGNASPFCCKDGFPGKEIKIDSFWGMRECVLPKHAIFAALYAQKTLGLGNQIFSHFPKCNMILELKKKTMKLSLLLDIGRM